MQKARPPIFLTGLPLGHAFSRRPPPITQPLTVSAPPSVLSLQGPSTQSSKSLPTLYPARSGRKKKKKKEKTCLYVIFSVVVNENDFDSLSFPARLDITGIPRPAKFLADRTNCPRISRGVRYSRFLIGASWLDTHHPWGEACNTVGLCWHVFDSGKEKQKQIL